MKLYFTRHGQTDWNAENRVQTRTDNPLNATGRAQALELAEKAAALGDIDRIVCSPMLRARETAEIVGARLRVPVTYDARLREWDYGRYEGCDRRASYAPGAPALRQARRECALRLGETGETPLRLCHRVYSVLEEIRANYDGQTVLLVAHGGVGRAIETYFREMTMEEFTNFQLHNCELRQGEL